MSHTSPNQPAHAHGILRGRGPVLAVVAIGGAVGALARYAVSLVWRNGTDAYLIWQKGEAAFPWTTLCINVIGCFLMGVLTLSLRERFTGAPHLLNPFLGTGVLGGFTTFSSFTDDTRRLVENSQPGLAAEYFVLTVVAALLGVVLGAVVTRAVLVRRRPDDERTGDT